MMTLTLMTVHLVRIFTLPVEIKCTNIMIASPFFKNISSILFQPISPMMGVVRNVECVAKLKNLIIYSIPSQEGTKRCAYISV